MELRNRRRLAGEMALGGLPFAGAFACMAMCLPSADAAAPEPSPPVIRALHVIPAYDLSCTCECDPEAWILVEGDRITMGATLLDRVERTIGREGPRAAAWRALEADLEILHADYFPDDGVIQIVAVSTASEPVSYQDLVTATEIAIRTGFDDVRIAQPDALRDLRPPQE